MISLNSDSPFPVTLRREVVISYPWTCIYVIWSLPGVDNIWQFQICHNSRCVFVWNVHIYSYHVYPRKTQKSIFSLQNFYCHQFYCIPWNMSVEISSNHYLQWPNHAKSQFPIRFSFLFPSSSWEFDGEIGSEPVWKNPSNPSLWQMNHQ